METSTARGTDESVESHITAGLVHALARGYRDVSAGSVADTGSSWLTDAVRATVVSYLNHCQSV